MMRSAHQALFDADLPAGFVYEEHFLTEEAATLLAAQIARIEFSSFEMRGVVARRRVAFFGRSYRGSGAVSAALPAFLEPLRERVAMWAGLAPAAFEMALVNDYPPGAPIGWHRDAPQYGTVAGVSLLSPCLMKFRPAPGAGATTAGRRSATHAIRLEPRSAYLMSGAARDAYEHHIPAVTAQRYSITFRTARPSSGG